MTSFRHATLQEFLGAIEKIRFTPALAQAWNRLDHRMIFQGAADDIGLCAIHEGDLHLDENFHAPAYHVLVQGDLIVDGVIDTGFPDLDEGGSFIVTGNASCTVFLSHYGKSSVIGGDLAARELLINAFEDSLLYVGGGITTHFFYGWDVWAEFGTRAEMDYGVGYCLPLNYTDAATQAVEPRFDQAASFKYLEIGNSEEHAGDEIAAHAKSGKPLFRR